MPPRIDDPAVIKKIKEDDQKAINKIRRWSFEVSPRRILPFKEVELTWDVTIPDDRIKVFLNGKKVANKGSRTVVPFDTTTYTLSVKGMIIEKELEKKIVRMDKSRLVDIPLNESSFADDAVEMINNLLKDFKDVELRTTKEIVNIDEKGIHLKVFLRFLMPGSNPRIDLTMSYIPGVDRSTTTYKPKITLKDSNINVWFEPLMLGVDQLYSGAATIIEMFLEAFLVPIISKQVKQSIEERIGKKMEKSIESGLYLFNIYTISDTLEITVYDPPPPPAPEEIDDIPDNPGGGFGASKKKRKK